MRVERGGYLTHRTDDAYAAPASHFVRVSAMKSPPCSRYRARSASRLFALAAVLASSVAQAAPIEILFVGNSFTHGRYDPVRTYNAANVHDIQCPTLPCTGNEAPYNGPPASLASQIPYAEPGPYGGIPGIFKQFATEAGLNYDVSIDTISAATLNGFFTQASRRAPIADARWDDVVLQEQSFTPLPATNLLGNATRGSFANFLAGVNGLTGAIDTADHAAGRPNAQVFLYETQPLASYTYTSTNPNAIEFGTTSPFPAGGLNSPYVNSTNTSLIEWMAADLHNAYYAAAAQNPNVTGVAPAGDAWVRAIEQGIAQRNPYLVNEPAGQVDLWDSNSDLACCTTPIAVLCVSRRRGNLIAARHT